MNKREIGTYYETVACQYLEEHGYIVIERNFRCRQGEIDIIAKEGDTLCFIEVKYRKDDKKGYPEEAIDFRKQQKIFQVANYYMISHEGLNDCFARFDAVLISRDCEEVHVVKNAFGGM